MREKLGLAIASVVFLGVLLLTARLAIERDGTGEEFTVHRSPGVVLGQDGRGDDGPLSHAQDPDLQDLVMPENAGWADQTELAEPGSEGAAVDTEGPVRSFRTAIYRSQAQSSLLRESEPETLALVRADDLAGWLAAPGLVEGLDGADAVWVVALRLPWATLEEVEHELDAISFRDAPEEGRPIGLFFVWDATAGIEPFVGRLTAKLGPGSLPGLWDLPTLRPDEVDGIEQIVSMSTRGEAYPAPTLDRGWRERPEDVPYQQLIDLKWALIRGERDERAIDLLDAVASRVVASDMPYPFVSAGGGSRELSEDFLVWCERVACETDDAAETLRRNARLIDALGALGLVRRDRAIELLRGAMRSSNASYSMQAARALGWLQAEEALDELLAWSQAEGYDRGAWREAYGRALVLFESEDAEREARRILSEEEYRQAQDFTSEELLRRESLKLRGEWP